MDIEVKPGRYVLAVSGGVDSVVLLDLFVSRVPNPEKNLLVAHYDHGIRPDSAEDRKFVARLAEGYGLEFFYEEGRLGPRAGEALAREKRYGFLKKVKDETGADAVVTAHHKDDMLETVIINILRGTGRKGLTPLASRPGLMRPLLDFNKSEILDYAQKKNLAWREDETNKDVKYLRNHIRHNLIPKLSKEQKDRLLDLSARVRDKNIEIDKLLDEMFFSGEDAGIPRKIFAGLGHDVSTEVMAEWLRRQGVRLDKKTVERLVIQLKTAGEGKKIQASSGRFFQVEQGIIRIKAQRSV